MFTDSLLISSSHMLKILGKDPMNCLLFESACLMGRSILQEGSETSVVALRHIVNKYCIFFMEGKLKHLAMKYIPLANWHKLAFPAMSSLTAVFFQSHAVSEGQSWSPSVLLETGLFEVQCLLGRWKTCHWRCRCQCDYVYLG